MVRKKIDNRIRVLIENGVKTGHRTMFVVVGDKGRDQVVLLHHMLSKTVVKARPTVLWCYKKELGFSSHRKKRMRQLQKKIKSGTVDVDEDNPFELFIASTKIRYCYYSETYSILGNTYGMCVLQDFEALTPNVLARTVETVEGGGIIVILLRTVASLKQLFTMNMDVHSRFRTEAHQDVACRFNERFILTLGSCENCIVMDDNLNILPISAKIANITPLQSESDHSVDSAELKELKRSLNDTQPVGALVECCKTVDQLKAVLKFIDAIAEKTLNTTVSLTAARGRGKSAALGLSIAAAVAFGYSNIYVTSPHPDNLKTLFVFIFKGFDALNFKEHVDYDIIASTNPEFKNSIVRVNVFGGDHRQTIQYIHPSDAGKLGQAELLVIDEAAAIPLPFVKALFGPYLIFLSSTINGYEGTGRSLSLKLIQQLRTQSLTDQQTETKGMAKVTSRVLSEITLEESIRYKPGDGIEEWLTNLLCLDATLTPTLSIGCPSPKDCELYYINRDTLFSYHKASEAFLHQMMSLYVSSHYKNSPNDLQMLSDAPAHHLFCLLGPVNSNKKSLPTALVVLQICLEGEISKGSISSGLARGKKASGDLIPWTIAQQFQDQDFPSLSGARIVRIATHPDFQGMGYGSRALQLLENYYELKIMNIDEHTDEQPADTEIEPVEDVDLLTEKLTPRKGLPPLLLKLSERPPEQLHYLGVSYGLTLPLLKFWKRSGFVPVYLRQTSNELTGEHSCIMLKVLKTEGVTRDNTWLQEYWKDFRRRFISLLSFQFRTFHPTLALSLLQNKNEMLEPPTDVSVLELQTQITPYDMKRLDLYTKNMADYHLVMDLIPALSRLYFLNKMGNMHLSAVQSAIMMGIGLQHKTVDEISKDLDLPASQLLGLFNRNIRKMLDYMNSILEQNISSQISAFNLDNSKQPNANERAPITQSLSKELEEGAEELRQKQQAELAKLKSADSAELSQYAIKGDESSWSQALSTGLPKMSVSVKVGQKRVGGGSGNEPSKPTKQKGNKEAGGFGKGWKKTGGGGGGKKFKGKK